MALVKKLVEQKLEHSGHHTEVECTYSIVEGLEGLYLQIDTYGSALREIHGQKSQTIRFAPEAIEQLKTLLQERFNNSGSQRIPLFLTSTVLPTISEGKPCAELNLPFWEI